MKATERLIVALDYPTLDEALRLVDQLGDTVSFYKIGLELMTAAGAPTVAAALKSRGVQIFLDGKFNDIPNTIEGACRETAKLGVTLFNVHGSIGTKAMEAAARAKGNSKIIAVTVLTALSDADCREIFHTGASEKVVEFATAAQKAGLDGVVCSPLELELLSSFKNFWKVTPGVRPTWASSDDQRRVMTPLEALQKGATHLVIGRPITKPPSAVGSPKAAAARILEEMEKAL